MLKQSLLTPLLENIFKTVKPMEQPIVDMPEDIGQESPIIDIDGFLDEFFVAKIRIVALEQENTELKQRIESMQRWKEEMERVMMNDTMNLESENIKREKRLKTKTEEQLCFEQYCQQHKNDLDIQERAVSKLKSLGYVDVKKAPWSVLKLELRARFNNLDNQNKSKYLIKASD